MSTASTTVLTSQQPKHWLIESQPLFDIQVIQSATNGYVTGVLFDSDVMNKTKTEDDPIGHGPGAPVRTTVSFSVGANAFDGRARKVMVEVASSGSVTDSPFLVGLAREVGNKHKIRVDNNTSVFHWSIALDATCWEAERPTYQKREADQTWSDSTDLQLIGLTCNDGSSDKPGTQGFVIEVTAFSKDPGTYRAQVVVKARSKESAPKIHTLEIEVFDSGIGNDGALFSPLPPTGN